MAGEKSPLVKSFACPHCGGTVKLIAAGRSLSATCTQCLSVIDVSDDNFRVLSIYKREVRLEPKIPIGARGTIRGDLFAVIGFVQKVDATGFYHWEEYLLFNPYKGYRWLVENQGHWTCFVMTKDKPGDPAGATTLEHLGRHYKLFDRGEAKAAFVLGEFYWRVKVGDASGTEDWICPPYMLSVEKDESEEVWSLGEYLEPQVVREAFKITEVWPERQGVGSNQPAQGGAEAARLFSHAKRLLIALVVVQVVTARGGYPVFHETYELAMKAASDVSSEPVVDPSPAASDAPGSSPVPSTPELIKTSPVFNVPGSTGSLTIGLSTDIHNSWLNLKIGLLEEPPGDKAFRFEREVSYYEGSDSDGRWTEGSGGDTVTLSSIPGGRYYLTTEGATETAKEGTHRVGVTVARDGWIWSNFFLGLLAIGLYPLIVFFRTHGFESRRWLNSDYNSFGSRKSERDDDDD